MDFVNHWRERTDLPLRQFIAWLGISSSKFYAWRTRYGKVNDHNARLPRDHWLLEEEKQAIRDYFNAHPDEGYRRLTFMMLDEGIVAVSPSSVWRVLHEAELLQHRANAPSKKGSGFEQPLKPHEHWHVDIAYLNVCGTFYYLCSVLDGASRALLAWDIGPSMTEDQVEIILQKAREAHPDATPRIISDNGPQFVARDFKDFIRECGMTHVRTSPFYPQSNGKIERWHKTLKGDCIRPGTPLSLEDARRLVAAYVKHYNEERLHSAIGYITPKAMLEGRAEHIWHERDRKLACARRQRAQRRAEGRRKADATSAA